MFSLNLAAAYYGRNKKLWEKQNYLGSSLHFILKIPSPDALTSKLKARKFSATGPGI